MLSRDQRVHVLRLSLERSLPRARAARDALRVEIDVLSNRKTLRRALHSVKTDAKAAGAKAWTAVLDDLEDSLTAQIAHGPFAVPARLMDKTMAGLQALSKGLAGGAMPAPGATLRDSWRALGREARKRIRGDRVRVA